MGVRDSLINCFVAAANVTKNGLTDLMKIISPSVIWVQKIFGQQQQGTII